MSVERLRHRFDGVLVEPGDDGYDAARAVWNAMVDRKPALIARCTTTADVVAALRFGRAHDLEIGVRGGGHSVLGLPVCDGGLMIDLSPMGRVRVDPGARRARIQGGALLGALDRAAQVYGLATTAGNVSHTGVGGLTLGGGTGWLARRLGLSCDNVASFELVTADGTVLRVSERENADLFWGLRGGAGNFGVVTEFEFRLHPVGTRALVATLFVAPDDAFDAVRGWRDLLPDSPRQATLLARAGVRVAPDPPVALRGRPPASIGYVWIGDPDEGRRLLPALRAACTPVAEHVVETSYVDLQSAYDDEEGSGLRRYWKDHYFTCLPDEAIRAFLAPDAGRGFSPAGRLTACAGAVADIPDDATAYSHRDAIVEFTTSAEWSDPAEDGPRMDGARRYARTLEPFASGAYVNALADEGQAGVRRAYPGHKLARLTALKDRYDPENVFHLNPNVPPTAT